MSKPKSSSTPAAGAPPAPIPATGPGSRPRAPKITQPAWYKATLSDGSYRIIEDDSAEAVAARIVSVYPASPQDFAQAGKDGVTLESKPTANTVTK